MTAVSLVMTTVGTLSKRSRKTSGKTSDGGIE